MTKMPLSDSYDSSKDSKLVFSIKIVYSRKFDVIQFVFFLFKLKHF